MAMTVGDILQITDVQDTLLQTALNVYFYRVESLETLADYDDVQGAFKLQIIDNCTPLQSSSWTAHTRIVIKNLTNAVDIAEFPYNLVGEVSGDAAPSFTALSFRLVRSTAITRHGSKRIGGITESMTVGNDLAAGVNTLTTALADAMAAPLVVDGTVDHDITLVPVIVGRIPQGEPNAGELDLSVINPVSSVQFIRVTTQTTRRAGRGI